MARALHRHRACGASRPQARQEARDLRRPARRDVAHAARRCHGRLCGRHQEHLQGRADRRVPGHGPRAVCHLQEALPRDPEERALGGQAPRALLRGRPEAGHLQLPLGRPRHLHACAQAHQSPQPPRTQLPLLPEARRGGQPVLLDRGPRRLPAPRPRLQARRCEGRPHGPLPARRGWDLARGGRI